jgi:signal transduction histidine kinase
MNCRKRLSIQKIIALVISLLAIVFIIFIWMLLRNRNKILKAKNLLQFKNDEIENNRIEISEKTKCSRGSMQQKINFSIIAHDLRNPIAAFVNISELLELDYDRISDKERNNTQMNFHQKFDTTVRKSTYLGKIIQQ